MTPCPAELDLSRALSEGAPAALDEHLAGCAACRDEHARLARAIELARAIDVPMPSAEHREEMRTLLLAAATMTPATHARPARSWRWVGALAAAAAVVLAVVVARGRGADGALVGHRHGTVVARGAASFASLSSTPDELVLLHDGTIDVDVAPLHAGERFRVRVGDAEVEVHGTAFAVTARDGRLVEVVVDHGVVEVRARDERRRLTAGQAWHEPAPVTAAAAPAPLPSAPLIVDAPIAAAPRSAAPPIAGERPPARPTPTPTPTPAPSAPAPEVADAPAPRSPEALAYDDGWAAMRGGRFAQAASAFARAQALAPTGPLAEDAAFWYAVALARAERPALATTAFRDFLAAFPTSRRVGEASAMLGWILFEAGDTREAARRFRAAITDPSPEVRKSAEAGLAAIAAATPE